MRKSSAIFAGVLIGVFLLGFGTKGPVSEAGQSVAGPASLVVDRSFGRMPLYFIRNEGQVDSRVGYYVQGKDKTIYFTPEGLTYVLDERAPAKDGDKKAAATDTRLLMDLTARANQNPETQSRWVARLDFVGGS